MSLQENKDMLLSQVMKCMVIIFVEYVCLYVRTYVVYVRRKK